MQQHSIFIGLGGNLPSEKGAPDETVACAIKLLHSHGVVCSRVSAFFETEPVPASNQPNFVNCVAAAHTDKIPAELLEIFQKVERDLGRTPAERWSARTIDIDLLAWDSQVLPDQDVWNSVANNSDPAAMRVEPVVPHPRLHRRAFVLKPMREIAPLWRHPVFEKTVEILSEEPEVQAQWSSVRVIS